MVLAPVAASAAVAAIDDEGLINKLFKIAILIGVLVLAIISVTILSLVIDIGGVFVDAGSGIKGAFDNITQAFNNFLFIFTFGASAFGFGGRK